MDKHRYRLLPTHAIQTGNTRSKILCAFVKSRTHGSLPIHNPTVPPPPILHRVVKRVLIAVGVARAVGPATSLARPRRLAVPPPPLTSQLPYPR